MKQNKNIIATIKKWNIENYSKFCHKKNFYLISSKKDLNYKKIRRINPQYIFFPHWSWLISEEIWSNFECIVFHMTDLPYGRGGTPLQNLILRGYEKTKISALKVSQGLDTGDIYYQEDLDLSGSAAEIYQRASTIIFKKMIPYIIKNNPQPKKQKGRVVKFARRKPNQSKIPNNLSLAEIYDFIRMLDAPGYPKAYLEIDKLKLEFSQAKLKDNKLSTKVKIYAK